MAKRQSIYMSKPAYKFLNHTLTSLSSTGQKVLQMCPSLTKLLPKYNDRHNVRDGDGDGDRDGD